MEILIKALQLILSLSILVVLHELGHFIPARLFKTRVEKFYLFFDPWFSLVKKKIGNTEYGIGWLPLGGYVKISGMIDESMDKDQMIKDPEPWEFRAKPAWQRLLIMLGGVTVNLLLGIFIYSMTLYVWNDTYLKNDNVVNGVICSDFAKDIGFEDGDKIVAIDGLSVDRFRDISKNMVLRDKSFIVDILRGDSFKRVEIGDNFIKHWKNSGKKLLFSPRTNIEVASVEKNSPSEKSGILSGDMLLSVNGVKTEFFDDFREELLKNKSEIITVGLDRSGNYKTVQVEVSENGTIGFMLDYKKISSVEEFGFFESFPAGYSLAMSRLGEYISQFALIFNTDNDLAGEMGGFGAIGNMFPSEWDWHKFWDLTAFLSLMLAFMNLLPIPALDGGHVVFLLYEIVARKPAPEKVMEYAQIAGMIILFSLLIFANGNDILRMF